MYFNVFTNAFFQKQEKRFDNFLSGERTSKRMRSASRSALSRTQQGLNASVQTLFFFWSVSAYRLVRKI